jgi:ribosomal protein L37AE/L43A
MATRTDGNTKRATTNTVTAMRRSAQSRQCPKCQRKSALKRYDDGTYSGVFCRWDDCDYKRLSGEI